MFFTRFRINTARTRARALLESPQRLHAAVLQGFPDVPPARGGPRVLWRLDRASKTQVVLYVVSPQQPDYTHLVEQAGWPTLSPGWETRDYTPLLEKLAAGQRWEFRLTANPVHHVRTDRPRNDAHKTKATAHRTPRHQAAWLLQRQERCGFRVVARTGVEDTDNALESHELTVHNQRVLDFGKNDPPKNAEGPSQRRSVRVATVTFDGRLEVTDTDALRNVLTAGIGRAKAYGCGLMTLAPPREETG
ncbi:type I-E CRISPR-associated protein Cas6/Cse3/CasE [Lipingzhangella sp. LS1_29]|uniref:Type I-E CRISPR-associated protein Cas6/Cse3/CasE n=1 Tax=Lipingzhangella rawalii TaxID=2055835 RepID=A0ABU2HAA6_9ACTN|nr:type I-E CRISPR-associated protein Cas6/Cse3/CasE [Lipingzhangella rawalii]MDS1272260.1 type I-E CRISPR-associated protein Cas6/Cse3/CasE [Lipingzhangella rawalii]